MAQFQSRASVNRAHSSVSTLTDQALIAFEIEHERNRLKEELNRLQSAQDDRERSLEILDFMRSRMDNDPLVNPSKNSFTNNTSSSLQAIPIMIDNNSSNSNDDGSGSDDDLSPMLEYLPSNTIIRLANKRLVKICNLCVGDKILSLCINSYPNGKSRNSYLPKPSKRPSQSMHTIYTQQNGGTSSNHSNKRKIPKPRKQQKKSLSGLPKRPRSRTTANISVPFMLPPPVQQRPLSAHSRPSNKPKIYTPTNISQCDDHLPPNRSQRFHIKQDSLPRKSMPFMPLYDEEMNGNHPHFNNIPYHQSYQQYQQYQHHQHHDHHHEQQENGRYPSSKNLIEQSVTAAVNESLILSNGGSNNSNNSTHSSSMKTRSKSMATTQLLSNWWGMEEKSPSPELTKEEYERKQSKLSRSRSSHSSSRSSASFTQIPGPLPPHQLQRKRMPSQPPPYHKMAKSQNNSPRNSNHHNHLHHNQPQFVYSKSSNNSPRSSNRDSNTNNNNININNNNNNKKKKQTRFSTNDVNLQKRYSVQKRNKNSNYLESVIVIKIIETKIHKMIEIITENEFKIRCTPTHLFWICGKGWGCFEPKSRVFLQKQVAIINKQKYNKHYNNYNNNNNGKKVKLPQIIHELKAGEQLLTVGGNKYRISYINSIEKPKGSNVYSIIVNKNDCFFANDLLVKNSISIS